MHDESKHEQIKQYLLSGKRITGLIALQLFGVYRLSSVIERLRKSGVTIITTIPDGKTYAVYHIPQNQQLEFQEA
jgi:hypothetical protein